MLESYTVHVGIKARQQSLQMNENNASLAGNFHINHLDFDILFYKQTLAFSIFVTYLKKYKQVFINEKSWIKKQNH